MNAKWDDIYDIILSAKSSPLPPLSSHSPGSGLAMNITFNIIIIIIIMNITFINIIFPSLSS